MTILVAALDKVTSAQSYGFYKTMASTKEFKERVRMLSGRKNFVELVFELKWKYDFDYDYT